MELYPNFENDKFDGGFSPEIDYFGLSEFGTRLTNLLLSLGAGSSLMLDGKWGTGKTHFAKLLRGHLKKQKVPVIYFNAFEHDHMSVPFEAICSAITKAANENIEHPEAVRDKFLKVAGKVGKGVALTAGRIGIRLATAGALDFTDLGLVKDNADAIADAIDDEVEKSVQAAILSGAVAERTLAEFRTELSELRLALSGEKDQPLIIIIDELDRCRPDFSIGLLESIKHFFGIPKIHFLLVTNLDQMEGYTNHLYGTGKKSREYLSKFYDVVISFPPKNLNEVINKHKIIVNNYFRGKFDSYHDNQRLHYVQENLAHFGKSYNLSIRSTLKACATAYMAMLSLKPRYLGPPSLIAILCVMKEVRPDLYTKAAQGTLAESEVTSFLEGGNWKRESTLERQSQILRWHVASQERAQSEEFKGVGSQYDQFSVSREEIIPLIISSVIEMYDFHFSEQ